MKVLLEVLHRFYIGHSEVTFGPDWQWIGLQTSDKRTGTRFLDLSLCPILGCVDSFQSDRWRMSWQQRQRSLSEVSAGVSPYGKCMIFDVSGS